MKKAIVRFFGRLYVPLPVAQRRFRRDLKKVSLLKRTDRRVEIKFLLSLFAKRMQRASHRAVHISARDLTRRWITTMHSKLGLLMDKVESKFLHLLSLSIS